MASVGAGLGLAVAALAQTPALDAVQRQQDRILQDDIQRQRERQRALEAPSRQPPAAQPATPDLPIPVPSGGCVQVERIEVRGARALPAEALQAAIRPDEGRCLSVPELEGLLRRLTNLYVDHGYVTSRVYLPAQDLAGGRLILVVLEGRIEGIELNQPGVPVRRELATAFPDLTGEVLYLRDLEQGLDQINRLASNNARMRLEPGTQAGSTRVFIDNTPGPRWRGSAGGDNSGVSSTGEHLGILSAETDNLLGLNDFWSLAIRRSMLEQSGRRNSQSYAGDVSVPYGRWTARLSASYFSWRSTVVTPTQRFASTGTSATQSARLDYMLHRDGDSKTAVSLALTGRQTANYVEDVRLGISSPELVTSTLGVTHDRRLLGGVFGVSLQRVDGLHVFGANNDADRPDSSAPEAQFEKWTASVNYSRAIGPDDSRVSWSFYAFGQWSRDPLYGSEQLGLGGLYTVRGFKEETVSGRTGFYMRNELIWRIPFPEDIAVPGWPGQVSIYTAHDYGVLRRNADNAYERGTMQGFTLGIRGGSANITFDISLGWPLSAPDFILDRGAKLYAAMTLRS